MRSSILIPAGLLFLVLTGSGCGAGTYGQIGSKHVAHPTHTTLGRKHGPWPLVSLGQLGSITWKCDARAHGRSRYAVQVRHPISATTFVRVSVGRRTSARRLDPGQVLRYPWSAARWWKLRFRQQIEPGTLHARVTIDFVQRLHGRLTNGYCEAYYPPRVMLRMGPRR